MEIGPNCRILGSTIVDDYYYDGSWPSISEGDNMDIGIWCCPATITPLKFI